MANNTRFIQVNQDVLLEYIQDDQFFYEENYSVVNDIKNNTTSFSFSKNITDTINYNKIPKQLYLVDKLIDKYGIADPDNKAFLQETKFVNNQPVMYDKIKIWFPIHFTFPNNTGIYLRTYTTGYNVDDTYNLSNFYLDTTIPNDFNLINIESKSFNMNGKLWGKSITIYVPSIYEESRKRTLSVPTLGTINYNLTNGVGLSQTSPIYFDFRFLYKKNTILGETTYITQPKLLTSLSQAPEFNTLGVQINKAVDGDYFTINGLYNNSIGEFESFMNTLAESGRPSYVLFTVSKYEDNILQDSIDYYVYENYLKKIDYRPIFKYTNTIASLRVDLKLYGLDDKTYITKSTEISIVGNDVSKYGKSLTSINITGSIKPKLYNSKPVQINLPTNEVINSHLKRKTQKKLEIRYVPYPVLINMHNIIASDVSTSSIFLPLGKLNLIMTPFDNIIKLAIYKNVNNVITPFEIPVSNTIVNLIFKSTNKELRIPLYIESNEVDLLNGILVFKIPSTNLQTLENIYKLSNTFYVTLTNNGIETNIYNGVFTLPENKVIDNNTKPVTNIITPSTIIPNIEIKKLELTKNNRRTF
jgi:hypothetical protein